jgi:hypothetical protein
MQSMFDLMRSTGKQVDVTGYSTVLFTGRFQKLLRSLQRYSLQIQPALSQMLFDVFHINR